MLPWKPLEVSIEVVDASIYLKRYDSIIGRRIYFGMDISRTKVGVLERGKSLTANKTRN